MRFRDRVLSGWRAFRGKTGPIRGGSPYIVIRSIAPEFEKAVKRAHLDELRRTRPAPRIVGKLVGLPVANGKRYAEFEIVEGDFPDDRFKHPYRLTQERP